VGDTPPEVSRVDQPLNGQNNDNGDLLIIAGSEAAVVGMAFSPDGRVLATANNQATLILWDVTDANAAAQLVPPVPSRTEPALGVGFSPNGRTLATVGFDNKATLWNVSGVVDLQDDAAETACAITGTGLDEATWKRYVPGLPYQNTCA
jgi:WD40 repeat protein